MKFTAKFLLVVGMASSAAIASPEIVGYYPYWAQYSQFFSKDVRFHLITTVDYVGFSSDANGQIAFTDPSDQGNFEELVKNSESKGIRQLITVGGADNAEILKTVSADDALRASFVQSCVQMLKKYGLEGLELDWTPTDTDKGNYTKLVDELISSLHAESPALTLTLSLPGSVASVSGFDVEALKKADYITLQAIDLMDENSSTTAPGAGTPLVEKVVSYWTSLGVPAGKIIPAVPFYGHSYSGANGLGSSFSGVGSGNEGVLSYKEILEKLESGSYKVQFDDASQTEIAVSESEAILFSGIPSIKSTASFVKNSGLGGVAAYDLSNDHIQPVVSLLVTINRVLRPEVQVKTKKH